jgi:hypothetical protein
LCAARIFDFVAWRSSMQWVTMPTARLVFAALVLSPAPALCAPLGAVPAVPRAAEIPSPEPAGARGAGLGELPVRFEPNVGQTNGRTRFLARIGGCTAFLTSDEAVLALLAPATCPDEGMVRGSVVRMRLEGTSPGARVEGEEDLPGKSNYFIGSDPSRWRTDVPGYARVRCRDVYPGVDLVYYGNRGKLEYDLVVEPGADPRRIAVRFEGAERIDVSSEGDLLIRTPAGSLRQAAPACYQPTGSTSAPVAGRYVALGRDRVAFELGSYDPSRPLVIDPQLVYSTYLGGGVSDWCRGLAVDASGAAYVAGYTASTDFPTLGAYDSTFTGFYDIYVTKLTAAGDALVYSTYLGGSSEEEGFGLAVDASGAAYVAGRTTSTDFPTANAFDSTLGGNWDAVVAKLSPSGNALVYSTYLGGPSVNI